MMRLPSVLPALGLIALSALSLLADEAPAPAGDSSAQAAKVLSDFGAYYAKLPGFRVEFRTQTHSEAIKAPNGKTFGPVDITADYTLAFARPNCIALVERPAPPPNFSNFEGSVYCDGKALYDYGKRANTYTVAPVPDDFHELGTKYGTSLLQGNRALPPLLSPDPAQALLARAFSLAYIELDQDGPSPAHHLKLQHHDYSVQLWIAAEGDPLLLKEIETNYEGKPGELRITTRFTQWQTDPVPPEAFLFFPPPHSKATVQPGADPTPTPAPVP